MAIVKSNKAQITDTNVVSNFGAHRAGIEKILEIQTRADYFPHRAEQVDVLLMNSTVSHEVNRPVFKAAGPLSAVHEAGESNNHQKDA